MNQSVWEIATAALLIGHPSTVCEIGVEHGSSFAVWSSIAKEDAVLVGVDLQDVQLPRRLNQSCHMVIEDSRNAHKQVIDCLGGRMLDFLFIDGDHTLEAVSADWELYSPLIRPGGVVGMHDIYDCNLGVRQVWTQAVVGRKAVEFRDYAHSPLMGIGLVWM